MGDLDAVESRADTRAGQRKSPACETGLFCKFTSTGLSVRSRPGLAAAEHAAEGAALHPQGIGALQRDRGVIGAAGVRIENPAAPFSLIGLHVDQHLFAVLVRLLVHGIAAEIA